MTGTTWSFGTGGRFELPKESRADLMLVSAISGGEAAFPVAATVAGSAAANGRPVLVAELRSGRPRRSGAFSTATSRGVAEIVRSRFRALDPVTRGQLCHLSLPADLAEAIPILSELPDVLPEQALCLGVASPESFRGLIEAGRLAVDAALLTAEFPRDRALAALLCRELSGRGIRCRVWTLPLKGFNSKLLSIGFPPGGVPAETATRLLEGLNRGRDR